MAKATLHTKIDRALKAALAKLAKQDNRSLSNLIETALREFVAEKKDGRSIPH